MGREVRVFRTVDGIGKESIDSLSDDGFYTYGYFKTLETAKSYNIVTFYLAVYDEGKIVAVAPCYVDMNSQFSALEKLPFVSRIVRLFGRMGFRLNRLVVCYSPNSFHSKILLEEGYDGKVILDLVSKRVDEVCRREKFLFSSFPYVSEFDGLLTDSLEGLGYVGYPSVDTFYLDVRWSNFDDYLKSLESCKIRKTVRREIRKCKESGVTIAEESEFGVLSSTLSGLHSNLFSRYNEGCQSPYGASFFSGLSEYAGDKTRVLIAKRRGKIVGFSLSLQHQDMLDVYLVGFDYDALMNTDFVYFNLAYYEPIKLAIEERIKRVHFSINSGRVKLKRGCKLEKTVSFVKCHNRLWGRLYAFYMKDRLGPR